MIIEPLSSYSSVKGVIELPYSKSIRARLLIINALNDKLLDIDEKDCRDIKILHAALKQILETKSGEVVTVDVQDSGTALRFLTAFCALEFGYMHRYKGLSINKYFEEETEQYNEYRKNTLLFNRKPIYPKFKLKHLVRSVNKYK